MNPLASARAYVSAWHLAKAPPQTLQRVRNARVCRVVAHAYEHVPYYRRLLDSAGVQPRHIRGVEDLSLIPPTTRETIQRTQLEDLTADNAPAARRQITSGSSGRPVTTLWTKQDYRTANALRLRAMWASGWRPGRRMARIRFDTPERTSRLKSRLRALLARWGLRQAVFSAWLPAEAHPAALAAMQPWYIHSYASYLATLARAALDAGVRLRPKLVTASGDALTVAARKIIVEAFACEVVDIYSCLELGDVAFTCRQEQRLHTHSDAHWVEALTPGGLSAAPEEEGELTCTSLCHLAMPRIRYQPGDLVVLATQPCPCGSAHPTIAAIAGRDEDMIRLPDGRLMSPMTFTDLFADYPRTQGYRLVQVSNRKLLLQVAPGDDLTADGLEGLRVQVVMLTRNALEVEVQVVSEVPALPSGKRRFVVPRRES